MKNLIVTVWLHTIYNLQVSGFPPFIVELFAVHVPSREGSTDRRVSLFPGRPCHHARTPDTCSTSATYAVFSFTFEGLAYAIVIRIRGGFSPPSTIGLCLHSHATSIACYETIEAFPGRPLTRFSSVWDRRRSLFQKGFPTSTFTCTSLPRTGRAPFEAPGAKTSVMRYVSPLTCGRNPATLLPSDGKSEEPRHHRVERAGRLLLAFPQKGTIHLSPRKEGGGDKDVMARFDIRGAFARPHMPQLAACCLTVLTFSSSAAFHGGGRQAPLSLQPAL